MRLVFDDTGKIKSFITGDSKEPAPPTGTTIDAKVPLYFARGVMRACARGDVTYENGHVCLRGVPYTVPPLRQEVTYGQALTAIKNATSIAQLRQILYHVCDQFLEVGALEL